MGGAVSGPKRGKRVAASPEAEAFLRTVGGFFASRDEVTKATPAFVQTNIATFFDDVGGGVILKQDVVGGIETQLDALYARASAAKEVLDGFGRRLVADAGLDPNQEMATEATDGEEVLRAYSAGPLKSRARAAEKAKDEYDGDAARLLDVVRGSIVCGDEASLVAVLKRLLGHTNEAAKVCVVCSKNRFRKPLFNGYRDVLVNLRLRLPDGTFMVVELQVHLVQILECKAKTKEFYVRFRTYFSGNVEIVAERNKVLEPVAGKDATAGFLQAVERAVKARDASELQALDVLLEQLAALDLLALVRECKRDMSLAANGEDSVENADALNSLAELRRTQGKFAAAEPLYRRALDIREKNLGAYHPDVATSLDNVAFLLQAQGKFAPAEPLCLRALAIREKELGPDHPSVAVTLNNLAELLRAQGKLDAAEPLYRRALAISEEQLRPDHPLVGTSLNNVAVLLQAQGRLDAAEPLYRRAVAIKEKQHGTDHPSVATSLGNLAGLLKAKGELDAAGILYRRGLAIFEQQLGPDHPSVAMSLRNLAGLLEKQGDLSGAEPLYRRALSIREEQLGPDHPSVATSLNNVALLLWRLGRLEAALPLQARATAICQRRGDTKNEAEYRFELKKMRRGAPFPYA